MILCLRLLAQRRIPLWLDLSRLAAALPFPFSLCVPLKQMIQTQRSFRSRGLLRQGVRLSVWQFLMQRPWMVLKRFANTLHFLLSPIFTLTTSLRLKLQSEELLRSELIRATLALWNAWTLLLMQLKRHIFPLELALTQALLLKNLIQDKI